MSNADSETLQPPPVEFAKEIRLAVVLYGGVSLAVYINGVVQELLHLVRATSESKIDGVNTGHAQFRDHAHNHAGDPEYLSEVEQVYRDIARVRTVGCGAFAESGAIQTRFVVDVISGTSAGGINGLFLGKALACGKNISELQDLWLNEADFNLLLNDDASIRGEGLAPQEPPRSLLNSSRLYLEILKALRAMDDSPERAALAEDIDLYLTTTDLLGMPTALEVMGRRVEELRHKFFFQFKSRHLNKDYTPFLAFAARCTSSFPVAFEPMRLVDIDPVVDLIYGREGIGKHSDSPLWNEFMEPFESAGHSGWRAFGDGGSLDNKPFGHAIDALLQREANVPVDRKLLYVEPDPEDVPHIPTRETPPDFIQNGLACLVTLPGYETIREDVQRILERNRLVRRTRAAMEMIENLDLKAVDDPQWKAKSFSKEVEGRDAAYVGYYKLKVTQATDELALMITCAAGLSDAPGDLAAVRNVVRKWREEKYQDRFNEFLMDFDFSYRVRRLRFVLRRIDRFSSSGETSREQCSHLRTLKRGVRDCLDPLLKKRETYRRRNQPPDREFTNAVAGFWNRSGGTPEVLQKWLAGDIPDELVNSQELDRIREIIAGDFEKAFRAASAAMLELFRGEDSIAHRIRGYYRNFENYDAAIFPMIYGTDTGELDEVEIVRISPKDSVQLFDQDAGHCRKLAGTRLVHFGALFKRDWRETDILWGRLDAAERIIAALNPPSPEVFTQRAHRAILDEAFTNRDETGICRLICGAVLSTADQRPNLTALIDLYTRINGLGLRTVLPALAAVQRYYVANFNRDGGFEPESSARELARSATIAGRMLDDAAVRHGVRKRWVHWLVYAGWALWSLLRIFLPQRLYAILARCWIGLLCLAGILVIFYLIRLMEYLK